MGRGKPQLTSLLHALDEAAYGGGRTLNLRESLPSAAEARSRTEVWLRARQVTKAGDVLIITGRGNQSIGGVGVIRQEILGMMASLRRRGIVESWREHSPGSIVVKLAPMRALLDAPRRRRDPVTAVKASRHAGVVEGLEPETRLLLRQLATQNVEALGVVETEDFITSEMIFIFSALVGALPEGASREEALRHSVRQAIEESTNR